MVRQIYHLRTLPHALVNPISELLRTQTLTYIGSDVPSKFYSKIQKIAVEGLKDVESFKQSWTSDESQQLWKRTLNEPGPQGSDVWRVDYLSLIKDSKAHEQQQASEGFIPAIDSYDPKDIVRDVGQKHESMKLEPKDSTQLFPLNAKVAGMRFLVLSHAYDNTQDYEVRYNETSKATHLQDGILRHLNSTRVKGNLEYLLVGIKSMWLKDELLIP